MKKKMISIAMFLVVFVATYLLICFGLPGMRIKLEAEPVEYFLESISHMTFVKTVASLAAALVAGAIPLLMRRED